MGVRWADARAVPLAGEREIVELAPWRAAEHALAELHAVGAWRTEAGLALELEQVVAAGVRRD